MSEVQEIPINSWAEVARLPEEQRAALAFGEALLAFPDGRRYCRETGPRLDLHFVIDLGGDEREVHDLFVNVENRHDLYCLRCGALDGRKLDDAYEQRFGRRLA